MNRFLPYITFVSLTIISATSSLPIFAVGCNVYKNKTVEIICDKDDTECKTEKTKNIELKETIEL